MRFCYTPAGNLFVALSRYFIFSIFLILSGFITSSLYAQSDLKITGKVVDSISGAPVAGANVQIDGYNYNVVSDINGNFSYKNLPLGEYSIIANRLGYKISEKYKLSITDYSITKITIILIPEPVLIQTLQVESSKPDDILITRSGNKTSYLIGQSGFESVADLQSSIPELEIVSSGAEKYIRIRGADLDGTTVMLDGRIINSTLSGRSDISSIPLKSVTQIEIVSGGDYRNQGLAGVVNFITGNIRTTGKIESSAAKGSFGYENYQIGINSQNIGPLKYNIMAESGYERGDFEYVDPRDSVRTRVNNYRKDRKLFGKLFWNNEISNVDINLRYFDRNSGVPGVLFQLSPSAKSHNKETEIYGSFSRDIGKTSGIKISSGATFRSIDYSSPFTPTNFIPYETKFKESNRDIRLQYQKLGNINFDFFSTLRYESLDGDDRIRPESSLGFHSRLTNSIGFGLKYNLQQWNLINNSSLSLGIRKDGGYKGDFWAPSTSLRFNFDLPFDPGIDFSYSTGRRLPDLIDSYWKEDAFATPNPDLVPEKSDGYEAGFDFKINYPFNLDFRTTGFVRDYDDLIIWRKWAGNKFKPVNLSKAKIAGWEYDISSAPFDGPFSIYWKAAIINPLNKENDLTHFDKYLTYRPVGSQSFGVKLRIYQVSMNFEGRHIGRRYITEENTKSLPPVDLVNLHISHRMKIKSFNINSKFSIINMGDVQYEILERQPEKPREFRFLISISKSGA